MVWTPNRAIISARAIPENLLTYVTDATRCRDTLDWALGSSTASTYKLLQKYTTSVLARSTPVFPSIAFQDDTDGQDLSGDNIVGIYSVLFEVSIQNASADTATTQARVYSKAIKSMIANCPVSTLTSGTGATNAQVLSLETGFLPIKTNEKQNDFLQQFQVKAGISITLGANT